MTRAGIPEELRDLKQWVVWRLEKRKGKQTKVPYQASTKRDSKASTTARGTWTTHKRARRVGGRWADGVGFVFTESDPYVGIDLDDVRDPETGEVEPWAQDIVDRLDSYTEVSQSGRGLHVIARGELPGKGRKRNGLEVYDRERYFCMTGDVLSGRESVKDRREEVLSVYEHERLAEGGRAAPEEVTVGDLVLRADAKASERVMRHVASHQTLRNTWNYARKEFHDDDSRYDQSLASLLARQGVGDQEIADAIIEFRRTHAKDKEKATRADYVTRTIATARAELTTGPLKLLPFSLVKRVQYGTEEASYDLVIEGREEPVTVEDTKTMESGRGMSHRLREVGYVLSDPALKQWSRITAAMLGLTEVVPMPSETERWTDTIHAYLDIPAPAPLPEPSEELGHNPVYYSREGDGVVVYLSASDLTEYLIMRLNQRITARKVAQALKRLGFTEYRRPERRLWRSPEGFLRPHVVEHWDQVTRGNAEGPRNADGADELKQRRARKRRRRA